MSEAPRKGLNLALQGGGAHGAYAWGVADRLLESRRVTLNAITATSAGAMNAAVIAYGHAKGGDEGAREALEGFWRKVSEMKGLMGVPDVPEPWRSLVPGLADAEQMISFAVMELAALSLSPYQFNPVNYNPLRVVLEEAVDFDVIHREGDIKLFISATNVRSGKVRVFRKEEVTLDAVMASACLPQLFQAVEIGGEAYWDGGYMGNPSLWPLFYETDVEDLLVVHINPIERDEVPMTAAQIDNRINEITFNSALLKEMRAVAFVQKLLRDKWVTQTHAAELSDIKFHAIRADKTLKDLSLASKYDTSWGFLCDLRDRGRRAAESWLDANWDAVGERGTVDLHAEFLDL
ncbi:patatin-like phospholipase family protein [Parvularcula dongshanensis]|uniref:NTE family protein n=1 Tax=Parvularcula dongshanensis TaxID=1173995 RepID=A0A840I152_9PROT|nr:patatin-like phospholipase family protein [Parvularcula dongshanensis]MBB4658467.1 NTE family protein [Parvularcula dongshanensis]